MTKIVMVTRYIQVDLRGSSLQIIKMAFVSDDNDDGNDDDFDGDDSVQIPGKWCASTE